MFNKIDADNLATLAVGLRLYRESVRSTALPSPLLCLLLTAALLADKLGTFSAAELATAQGLGGWQVRASIGKLETAGMIHKLAGRQYFKAQSWGLTPAGHTLTRNTLTRLRGLRDTLALPLAPIGTL